MNKLGKYSRSVSIIGVGCTPFMYTVDNEETNGLTEGEMFGYAALKAMEDASLITAIANQPSDVAKQVCLYAMMKQYRLVWDFMITVIGTKFESFDMSYSKSDLNVFMMRLQEQDDWVATWSENTITKVKQVLARVLIENEYIDSPTADHLNPVLISPILENAIRASNDTKALIAFNCLA